MGKYLSKKVLVYLITFFVAVTVNWAVPRFMPGDPISLLLARFSGMEGGREIIQSQFVQTFGFDQPLLVQYFNFWKSLFVGDLGISISFFPAPVMDIVKNNIIYDFIILVPAIILSWIVGNKLGAYSGGNKKIDNRVMPFFYFLTSAPEFWFSMVLVFVFGVKFGWFPVNGAYSSTMHPGFNFAFIFDVLKHWFLPFLSIFLIQVGGWAIGMRNMIIYEKVSNYSRYMKSLGASDKLIRSYGFRNGVLPQVTGLAISLSTFVAAAVFVERVFAYPGLGNIMVKAVLNQDFFLMQGCFLAIITMVLVANFIVDIIYMLIDPRVRLSYSEEV